MSFFFYFFFTQDEDYHCLHHQKIHTWKILGINVKHKGHDNMIIYIVVCFRNL